MKDCKEYQDIPNFHPELAKSLLGSNDEEKVIEGLLSVVLYSGDYQMSIDQAVEFAIHDNKNIRGCSILCFGHIARTFGKLDMERVKPLIRSALVDKSDFVRKKAHDAVEDIKTFLPDLAKDI